MVEWWAAQGNNLMEVIDLKVAIKSIKSRWIKQNSQDWIDGEVSEKISVCDKVFEKCPSKTSVCRTAAPTKQYNKFWN